MKKLKKELSLFTASFYGIGIILGAGIYVLIGEAAGIAGNALWLSFTIAALLATFTGLSYAELSSMFPRSAAEYTYMKQAFKSNSLAFSVQWIMLVAIIVSISAVALGFGGYFSVLFGTSQVYAAIGLIAVMSIINYIGIKESTRFNILATSMELLGLLIVIAVGAFFIGKVDINYLAVPGGFNGVIAATSLIFFAYIGFEELVNLSEETKNATKIIPKALIISIIVTTILYILVSIAAVSVLGWETLSQSSAPMTSVVAEMFPSAGIIMSIIALFATGNTVLAMMIVASRMTYGLSYNKMIPSMFGKVGKRQTPYISIVLVSLISLAALSLGGIKTVALLTDIGIFLVYIFINSALLWLRFKQPKTERPFKSPLNIGKISILAVLGIATSIFMLTRFEPKLLAYELIIVMVGLFLYIAYVKLFRKPAYMKKGKSRF